MNNELITSGISKLFIQLRLVPDPMKLDDKLKTQRASYLFYMEAALNIYCPDQIQTARLLTSVLIVES